MKIKTKELKNLVLNYLSQNKTLSMSELAEMLNNRGVEVKPATLRWKLYALRKEGLIADISKGIYEIKQNDKNEFLPSFATNDLKKIAHKIKKEMPGLTFCVWTTTWLNQFMIHQPVSNLRIVEVEPTALTSVFSLFEDSAKDILLNPSKDEIDKYLLGSNKLVVKPLINHSPIKKGTIPTPKLEKILVDLFAEKELFYSMQGTELSNIFANALDNYQINLTTLFSYAKRRNKGADLLKYLNLNIKERINDSCRISLERMASGN